MTVSPDAPTPPKTVTDSRVVADAPLIRNPRRQRILTLLLAAVVLLSGVLLLMPRHPVNTPQGALASAWSALQMHDLKTFSHDVDVAAVAHHMMAALQPDSKTAPPLPELLQRDLANYYAQQLQTLVSTGSLPRITQQLDTPALLWQMLGTPSGAIFHGTTLQQQNNNSAILVLGFTQPEFNNAEISLKLLLHRTPAATSEARSWRITGVADLAALVEHLQKLRSDRLDALNQAIQEQLNHALTPVTLVKSTAAPAQWDHADPSVLWRVAYRNTSGQSIISSQSRLHILSHDGTELRVLMLADDDTLAPGDTSEKAWPMPLDPANKVDTQIAAAAPDQLTLRLEPITIQFADGHTLKARDQLPLPAAQEVSH